MIVDPQKIKEIETLGFTIVENVLPQEEIPFLINELEQMMIEDNQYISRLEADGNAHRDRDMAMHAVLRGPHCMKLLENDHMHAYLEAIMDPYAIIYANQASSMPPRKTNYSSRIHVDCPRFIPGYMTNSGFFFALCDINEENGATWFLQGSHLTPDEPSEEYFEKNAVRACPKAGDMVVFNARLWHRGGQNHTDQFRHAITFNMCRSFMRSRFDHPRLIENMGSDVLNHIGLRGRRLLGYDVRLPASQDEFYLPEGERLYKAGQG